MAPSTQDERSVAPSISAPRRLDSQAERRVKQTPPLSVSQKKHGLPEDCNPNVDGSVFSTSTVVASRTQSKIQLIINSASYLRRHSSEESRPSDGQKATHQRTVSTKSVVEFPKAAWSQSSIPVRSPKATANNQRKRLLSRNDEEEVQPRVRQRLHSAISIETLKGIAFPESRPSQEEKPPKERRRLDSMRSSIFRLSNILDPGRSEVASGVISTDTAGDQKLSVPVKRKSLIATLQSVESKGDSRIRKPFARTQTPSTTDVFNSHSLNLESVVDEILSTEAVTLAYDGSDMCLDDLEEIPDLLLSHPPSLAPDVVPNAVKAVSNLNRFDIKIISNRNTEVWDTLENGVYAWEGSLCVTDNNVKAIWASRPPVDRINLECRAREPPTSPRSSFSSSTPAPLDYQSTYQGQSLHEVEVLKSMDYTRGITVNKKWERQYSYQEPNKVVWLLKFWVPIPMNLFHKLEDRQFRLRAKLTFRDPFAGGMKVVAHSGSVDMGISSLKTAKFVRSPH